jgi:hypothetical protein
MAEQFSVLVDTNHRTTRRDVNDGREGLSEQDQIFGEQMRCGIRRVLDLTRTAGGCALPEHLTLLSGTLPTDLV